MCQLCRKYGGCRRCARLKPAYCSECERLAGLEKWLKELYKALGVGVRP